MKAFIEPSNLKGSISAPASKSSMQRACAAALVCGKDVIIHQPGHSNDDKAALDIIQKLGAIVEPLNGNAEAGWTIKSKGIAPVASEVNCGESGLSIRMFTPLVALSNQRLSITGGGSLSTRPMDFFDNILPQLSVKIQSNQGKLPLTIQGPLIPENIEVDGSLSSQFLTGLLLAYAAAGASGISIRVNNLKSRPYIDLTLEVMKQFGLNVPDNRNYEEFVFKTPVQVNKPEPVNYTVEGDWSGAAFLLVAGAIAGPINVRGLDIGSTQADKAILEALMSAGAGIAIDAKGIQLNPEEMKAFEFDANDCPDLFPPLVALAAYCNGNTRIKGVNRLTHKESNRALTLQEEFGKMGLTIELDDDWMMIAGGNGLKGASVHSRHDHRIAMACAIAAIRAEGKTTIAEAQAIDKSYPDFYTDLQHLGASIVLHQQFKFHE